MMSPSCNICVGVQTVGCAQGFRYLVACTLGMSFGDATFRKRALSLQDWLDDDGEHSTSDYTPAYLSCIGVAELLLEAESAIQTLFSV